MNKFDLEKRTMGFALRVMAFVPTLPKDRIGDLVTYQLVKAGTSVGANYREANRAESRKDFIHKLAIVQKEAAESEYWLELCNAAGLGECAERCWLLREAGELLAIFTSPAKTAKSSSAKTTTASS